MSKNSNTEGEVLEYVPYGPEWVKEMTKWDKKSLINYLGECLQSIGRFQSKISWRNAKQEKPECLVSVLVFIPEEDEHITVGMWDISKCWVLLDEYRKPISEVTHWMPLPMDKPSDVHYTPTTRTEDEENTSGIIRTLQERLHVATQVIHYYTQTTGDDGTERIKALERFNELISRGGGV